LRARARPEPTQLEDLSGASFLGKLLVLPANVRLDWKVIAKYKHSSSFGFVVSNKGKKFYTIDTQENMEWMPETDVKTVARKVSQTMEQVIHQANMEWKIPSYLGWSKACPVGFIQSSGIFVFNFGDDDDGDDDDYDDNEIYKFQLQICPRFLEASKPEGAKIYILNRNKFSVGIETSLIKPAFIGSCPKDAGRIESGESISFRLPPVPEHGPIDLVIECGIKIFTNLTGPKEPKEPSLGKLISSKRLLPCDVAITSRRASFRGLCY
jgi:hypothetical protein